MGLQKSVTTSWSVSRYGITFLLMVMAIFLVLSAFVVIKLGPILTESARSQNTLAQEEMSAALTVVIETALQDVSVLANWDETKQQIGHPEYYIYWHDYRVKDSGLVNSYVIDVELFDAKGKSFASSHSKLEKIPKSNLVEKDVSFETQDNKIYILATSPIFLNKYYVSPNAYIRIKIDLLKMLAFNRALLRVKSDSLRLIENSQNVRFSKEVLDKLTYEYVDEASHSALASLIVSLLIQSGLLLLVSASILYWILYFRFSKPLQELANYIDRSIVEPLNLSSLGMSKIFSVTELEKVRKSLGDYQGRLSKMQENLEASNAQLWAQAHKDSLTTVYNRRAFDEDFAKILMISKRREVNIAFILFDCDHFKPINDTYGHHVGDEVIRGISFALTEMLRNEEKLYRFGGDEFACLLTDTNLEDAKSVAIRAEKAVANYDFSVLGVLEPIRISVGVAHYRGQESSELEKLSRHADIAMYVAKRPGNSKVSVYEVSMAEMGESVISSMETAAVYEALTNSEVIQMHYQPIVALPSNTIEYYESLVRLNYNDKMITPAGIFPVVEARRLEAEFDLAVVKRVALDLELGVIPKGTGVAINISGPGILSAEVLESLHSMSHWTKPYKLVIEITETALITKIGYATTNLQALRKVGFIVALDDFGSGYSSMRYLSDMPVDTVKFDIALVRNLMGEVRQREIVEDLAHLIRHAGYQMVAEGIEDEDMLNKIKLLGFTHGQGYHLGRPARLIVN
jgi:diguanylate cyclase (GGDEF)-like protein